MRMRRLRALLTLAALVSAGALAPAAAEQTDAARIERLEAQVRALLERVAVLEADQGGQQKPGEIAWQLDEDIGGRTFRIVHKALDVDDGRIELLLQVTGAVPAVERWLPGGPAPVRITLRAPDGSERQLYMTLIRGASFEPGKHLHLLAELDPAVAAAATEIVVEHAQ